MWIGTLHNAIICGCKQSAWHKKTKRKISRKYNILTNGQRPDHLTADKVSPKVMETHYRVSQLQSNTGKNNFSCPSYAFFSFVFCKATYIMHIVL